jgi:iron complex transport system substrate-binding protein
MPRIVSLIASATEIVCALGCEEQLVGRSHECDFPPSVQRLPVCTEPKFNVHGRSAEIDARVKAILRNALSVYLVDADRLRELRPDVIVTQAHCEVCAVSQKDVEAALCHWIETRPALVSLHPNGLADVWASIHQVAGTLGIQKRAVALVQALQARIDRIAAAAGGLTGRPTVACIEWLEPLMAAGNWMPELVQLAGGIHLFGQAGKHSPTMTWEQLVERDPDVIVVAPCGWDIAKSRTEMSVLVERPDWPGLKAVRQGRVFLTDGNQYFNRPGPRLVESLEILAEVLHPEAFHFGHQGNGWQKL